MNIRELKEIFRLVEKTDFTEVEIVQGDWRLRVERGERTSPQTMVPAGHYVPTSSEASIPRENSTTSTKPIAEPEKTPEIMEAKGLLVTSPFVGTFYRSPSPDSPSYVEVGDMVKKGQILCIVEAMKLMNEIESDVDGKVMEIYPANSQAVEFGESLLRIEPL